jgi:Fe-S-cluster-containing dehydrogenase component
MKFNMPSCGGCRTCELACSFHHTGEYNPEKSSFKIVVSQNGSGHDVVFPEVPSEGMFPCDGCAGFEIPFCMSVCWEKDELEGIIEEYLSKNSKGQVK